MKPSGDEAVQGVYRTRPDSSRSMDRRRHLLTAFFALLFRRRSSALGKEVIHVTAKTTVKSGGYLWSN